jgi:SNF2 family DNA or RNA helicase
MDIQTKLISGGYLIPATLVDEGDKYGVKFSYSPGLIAEIKCMEKAHWCGFDEENPRKIWTIPKTPRNLFQLDFLQGKNPYAPWDAQFEKVESTRPLRKHQFEQASLMASVPGCIIAAEMGTGKSLSSITAMEHVFKNQPDNASTYAWYVGPKSGVKAFGRELNKWAVRFRPKMFTYEGLVKYLKENDEMPTPIYIIFDESSKLKTPTSQRSQAALYVANQSRKQYGEKARVILMSGTPSPKSPADWWMQCEIACPGYVKEGDIHKFKARLCLIEERQSLAGGVYPHIVTWLDDENKCSKCGQRAEDLKHVEHQFVKSKNEVKYLYERMKGLVLVHFKKDCTDLPEKQYRLIYIKPSPEFIRLSNLIKSRSPRVIEAMTALRELSDGFQYSSEESGTDTCPHCHGEKMVNTKVPDKEIDPLVALEKQNITYTDMILPCENCSGTGEVKTYKRVTESFVSPKDEAYIELLEDHEDVGRFVVWGGFTGTIERLVQIAHQEGWCTLRIDGKGYIATSEQGEVLDSNELLDAMDKSHPRFAELIDKYPKVCVVGHPQAGGMALTLTASPTALYYSNCFSGEARMQSEDRIHRLGMDSERGATIIDLIHLPVDKMVLANLRLKKNLQNLSMGELEESMKHVHENGIEE